MTNGPVKIIIVQLIIKWFLSVEQEIFKIKGLPCFGTLSLCYDKARQLVRPKYGSTVPSHNFTLKFIIIAKGNNPPGLHALYYKMASKLRIIWNSSGKLVEK